eukprot:jgi/Tetstr1/463166/TSEL_008100.t1
MTPHELREVAAGYFFLPSPCLALVVGSQIILPSTQHNPVTVDLYGDALMNLPAPGDAHWRVQHDAIADAFRDHCVHDMVRDAAWHNTEPGQKGPLRDILDMSEYTGMVFGTLGGVSKGLAGRSTFVEAPFCVLNPIFLQYDMRDAELGNGTSHGRVVTLGLQSTLAMQLAVEHVNSGQCGILGPQCEKLLDAGGGRRLVLKPFLSNVWSSAPHGATPAVQACISTDAEVIAAGLSSDQVSLVSSFIGGLGRLFVSHTATSSAFTDKDTYPTFARTATNSATLVIASVHLVQFFGWKDVALVHSQSPSGYQAVEVFTSQLKTSKALDPTLISLNPTEADGYASAAARLIESNVHVVTLYMVPNALLRFLAAMEEAVTAAGLDYTSYTWIVPYSTKTITELYSGPEFEEQLVLFEGMLGLEVGYSATGRAWLQAQLRQMAPSETYTTLGGYYMNATGAWDSYISMDEFSAEIASTTYAHDYSLNMYDAVWSIAFGMAAAALAKWNSTEGSQAVTGTEVEELIQSGRFPAFEGASGRRAFLSNGDWDLNHTDIIVSNYATPPGLAEARHVDVAAIHVATYEVELLDEPVVWSNGREYPYVPADSRAMATFSIFITCAVVGLGVLLAVSVWLIWRNWRLKNRVHTLMSQAREDVPVESPLGRMLEFLHQYGDGGRRHRPTRNAARQLAEYITSNSSALTVPDIGAMTDDMSSGIKDFLLSNARQSPDKLRRMSKSLSMLRPAGSMISASGSGPGSQLENGLQATSAALMEVLQSATSDLQCKIGCDFFLDFVTPQSPFQSCPSPLPLVVLQSARSLGLLQSANALDHLVNFSRCVESGYADSLYHCKSHGADVTQRLITILNRAGLANLPSDPTSRHSPLVGLVSLVAATVHDYGHPQVSNHFLEEQEDAMAIESNYQAPAEHFALRETLKLLEDSSCDFLAREQEECSGTVKRRKGFRKMVVKLVLGTDMSAHFDLVAQFKAHFENKPELKWMNSAELWVALEQKHRLLVLQVALKVADIGHCALPWDIHREWLQRLEDEFFEQGDKERAAGYPVSALMDRNLPGATAASNQVGFYKVIVLPLLKAWVSVFPSSAPLLEQAHENLARYNAEDAVAAMWPRKKASDFNDGSVLQHALGPAGRTAVA